MIDELDLYLALVSYISDDHIRKQTNPPGQKITESTQSYKLLNQAMNNKDLIKTTLPFMKQVEAHYHIEQILLDYQNQRKKNKLLKKNQTQAHQINMKQSINEVLIQMDDMMASANQAILLNNQLIQLNKENIHQKIQEDSSYESEHRYTLATIEDTINKENTYLANSMQSVKIITEGIEALLRLQAR